MVVLNYFIIIAKSVHFTLLGYFTKVIVFFHERTGLDVGPDREIKGQHTDSIGVLGSQPRML